MNTVAELSQLLTGQLASGTRSAARAVLLDHRNEHALPEVMVMA